MLDRSSMCRWIRGVDPRETVTEPVSGTFTLTCRTIACQAGPVASSLATLRVVVRKPSGDYVRDSPLRSRRCLPCPFAVAAVAVLSVAVPIVAWPAVAWQRRLTDLADNGLTGHDRGTGAGANPREAIQVLQTTQAAAPPSVLAPWRQGRTRL